MVKWNLESIYKFEDTDKLIHKLKEQVAGFKTCREKLNSDISVDEFMDLIRKKEEIVITSTRLYGYSGLKLTENTADSKSNTHNDKISEITTDADNELLFFNLWFKELSDKDAQKYIDGSGKYRYFLERIRAFRPHSLKEKEEQIINLKDITGFEATNKFYDIITNRYRYEWEGKMLSAEEISVFKKSPDRDKRKAAYDKLYGKYGEEQEVLGELYKNLVADWRNENVKLRNFSSPIAVRNHSNDIPDKAIAALLNVVRRNVDLIQDYFKVKSKILGLEKMDRYDLYAPYSKEEKEYTYEECKSITLNLYKDFDEKAYDMAKTIFDAEHVHSELTENKQSGAFCWTVLKDLPPYILLNFTGKLRDLQTMVHEFGHGIHGIAGKDQTQFTFHSAIPLAETASIFGEVLLAKSMLKDSSDEKKINLLVELIDGEYASIFRQAFFVLFEIDAHKMIAKGATIDELNKLYLDNLKEQFGDSIDIPDVFKSEWNFIPHIHHTPFYCYGYAFGNLLVLSLYKMYEEQGKDFVPKYFKILSYGGSKSPADILSEVGIDITTEEFWEQGISIIKEQVEELKRLTS